MAIVPSKNPKKYVRVLKLATKPTMHEIKMVSAVAGGGIGLVGLLGFAIYTAMSYLPM